MFYNGKKWVADVENYGFTARAKEIAAAGKFPKWYMTSLLDYHLNLSPIGIISVKQTDFREAFAEYHVSLTFYLANITLAAPFLTLEAAKIAGMNKFMSALFDTHRDLEAGFVFETEEQEQMSGFRGEIKDWVAIVGPDSDTLFTNGGRIVDRQPVDRSGADLSPDTDNSAPETGQGPKIGP